LNNYFFYFFKFENHKFQRGRKNKQTRKKKKKKKRRSHHSKWGLPRLPSQLQPALQRFFYRMEISLQKRPKKTSPKTPYPRFRLKPLKKKEEKTPLYRM